MRSIAEMRHQRVLTKDFLDLVEGVEANVDGFEEFYCASLLPHVIR
jgi:hypothetical protein